MPTTLPSPRANARMVTRRALRERRWQRIAGVAVACGLGWGMYQAWRVASSPSLHASAVRAQVAGCYRVRRGPALLSWANPHWPPAVARFDTARWVKPEEGLPRVRQGQSEHVGGPYWGESMIRSPDGTPGWWRPTGARSISVNWTHRGLGGFRGSFRLDGADLVGSGEWFQDFRPFFWFPPRLLSVRLFRVECDAMGEVAAVGAATR